MIEVKNVSYTYMSGGPFETAALKNMSLSLEDGEFIGLMGHTGSGKSTLVQIIGGLEKPTEGSVVIDGQTLHSKECDMRAMRFKIGLVMQYPEYQLFEETVFRDIAFGPTNMGLSEQEIRDRVELAADLAGVKRELLEKSPFELSGGQKRRVAIAGVIVTKPEILVLDEPAAGLDPLGKQEIMQLLHKIHKEWCKTVIIVSHDMDEISENCTRAAVFSDGKVVREASPAELFLDYATLSGLGLDIPFTAKVTELLEQKGVKLRCDFTSADFVRKTLEYAGLGGREDA